MLPQGGFDQNPGNLACCKKGIDCLEKLSYAMRVIDNIQDLLWVTVRDHLTSNAPLSCKRRIRSFLPLATASPNTVRPSLSTRLGSAPR